MKNNLLKWYMFAFFMAGNLIALADPGDDDGSGGLEGDAPINNKLIWLALAGVSFALYYFSKVAKQKKAV